MSSVEYPNRSCITALSAAIYTKCVYVGVLYIGVTIWMYL